jgi:nifR3 family TIM-barrel protein
VNCQPNIFSIDPSKYKTPIFLQLLGNNSEYMAQAALVGEKAGFDGIDINFGCPSATVTKKGCGSALLDYPEKLFEITSAIKKSIKIDLTVKIRSGYQDSNNFMENILACEEAGASMITIHPRLRSELYSGLANWDFIKLAKEKLKIPVCGNGDINSIEDASKNQKYSGCDYLMVGRGSVSNPFIFKELYEEKSPNLSMEEFYKVMKIYYEKLAHFYVERYNSKKMALTRLKQHISYLKIDEDIKLKFFRSKKLEEIYEKFNEYL